MSLLHLPLELLISITPYLPTSSISRLILTCKPAHHFLRDHLYREIYLDKQHSSQAYGFTAAAVAGKLCAKDLESVRKLVLGDVFNDIHYHHGGEFQSWFVDNIIPAMTGLKSLKIEVHEESGKQQKQQGQNQWVFSEKLAGLKGVEFDVVLGGECEYMIPHKQHQHVFLTNDSRILQYFLLPPPRIHATSPIQHHLPNRRHPQHLHQHTTPPLHLPQRAPSSAPSLRHKPPRIPPAPITLHHPLQLHLHGAHLFPLPPHLHPFHPLPPQLLPLIPSRPNHAPIPHHHPPFFNPTHAPPHPIHGLRHLLSKKPLHPPPR
ncbi:hypothetical protein K440DRAFT_173583 [Wilcoxina mikolae CBS 423.85]|nr:hypothetical protein K440DRAFT_173583 [Wilcoxina mikolae CBS 423.85]